MVSLWEPASLHTLIPYFFSLQHAHTKNKHFCLILFKILSKRELISFVDRILVWISRLCQDPFSGRVFNQQVIWKISNVSFILIHILQNADMQINQMWLPPPNTFLLRDIDLIFQKCCTNLTFWKYSARYWLNPISSRSNLCACARCKPEVALIYWKSSFLWESRAHNFYTYFQQEKSLTMSRPIPLGLCIAILLCSGKPADSMSIF